MESKKHHKVFLPAGESSKPTGARKKETLRAAREETEERRQKAGTLREPNTPETVPQELLSTDWTITGVGVGRKKLREDRRE